MSREQNQSKGGSVLRHQKGYDPADASLLRIYSGREGRFKRRVCDSVRFQAHILVNKADVHIPRGRVIYVEGENYIAHA